MVKTEEILGQKWDKCVLDAGIKMSSGLAIGKLFKKKMFLKRFINFKKLILFSLVSHMFDSSVSPRNLTSYTVNF